MITRKKRGRKRTGCVSKQGNQWRGLFTATGKCAKDGRRSVMLGRIDEVTEEEARAKLDDIMRREGAIRDNLRLISAVDFIVPMEWKAATENSIDKQSRGVLAELIVTADLIAKGLHPYKAVSPGAPCDLLVILPDWKTVKVEVKSGRREQSGAIFCDVSRNVGKFDVLAVVIDGREIVYASAADVSNVFYPLTGAADAMLRSNSIFKSQSIEFNEEVPQ